GGCWFEGQASSLPLFLAYSLIHLLDTAIFAAAVVCRWCWCCVQAASYRGLFPEARGGVVCRQNIFASSLPPPYQGVHFAMVTVVLFFCNCFCTAVGLCVTG
ncbi:unnamed protein product, partial [Laminaria digitata]